MYRPRQRPGASTPSTDQIDPATAMNPLANRQGRQQRQEAEDRQRGRASTRPLDEDEIHAIMRPSSRRFWIVGALGLVVLGYLLAIPLLGLAAFVLVAINMLPEVWRVIALRDVEFHRTLSRAIVPFGGHLQITYTLENRKRFPVPWLEIEDEYGDALRMEGTTAFASYKPERNLFITGMTLWVFQRVRRTYKIQAVQRGVFLFGPTYLRSGDPFGFQETNRRVRDQTSDQRVIVLPIAVPLTKFGLPSRRPFGDLRTAVPTFEDLSQVIGARDYAPTDSLRRIHWQATARQGKPQSKLYPPTTDNTLMILLDINTNLNPTAGFETALVELGVAAAASVARWASAERFAVGVVTNALPASGAVESNLMTENIVAVMRVSPSAHKDHLGRLLRVLAQVQPYLGHSMARVVAREETRLPLGATVIYIGAALALRADVVERLQRMRRHGHVVALLLTGDAPAETGGLLSYRLGGTERWYELARSAARGAGIVEFDDESPEAASDRGDPGATDSDRADHTAPFVFTVG